MCSILLFLFQSHFNTMKYDNFAKIKWNAWIITIPNNEYQYVISIILIILIPESSSKPLNKSQQIEKINIIIICDHCS